MTAFVTGLARSRTFWFSEYFRAVGMESYHEFLNGCHDREEFYRVMRGGAVNCDCGLYMTDWQEKLPEAKCVVIHRNPKTVHRSMERLAERVYFPVPPLGVVYRQSVALSEVPGLHVEFDDIDDRIQEIHEYVTDIDFDRKLANMMIERNLQTADYTVDMNSYRLWVA